jgi:hypothetical protein
LGTGMDREEAPHQSRWKNIWDGVEWIGKLAGSLSAIRFAQRMLGQSPSAWLHSLLDGYTEVFYPPVDMTVGQLAKLAGLDLPPSAKDLIVFYFIFVGIFFRTFSAANHRAKKSSRDRRELFFIAIFWPASVVALVPMYIFALVFPEEERALAWVISGLKRETFTVIAIVTVACVGTAAGFL